MSSSFSILADRLNEALEIPGLSLPIAGIKIFHGMATVSDAITRYQPEDMTVTSRHAIKSAMAGDAVCLTEESIGCIAGAISLGMVEKRRDTPLKGRRVYTELMRKSSGKGNAFIPPSPAGFTDGRVYACKDAGCTDYSLFGKEDSGRFRKLDLAAAAVPAMPAIQPPTTQGVFLFPAGDR